MAVNLAALNATITALTAEVARTEGTEESAGKLISGFSAAVAKAVTDALAADDAADQGSIDAAGQAIADVTARFVAADDKLGQAITANSGS
jgi:hypothetical protein